MDLSVDEKTMREASSLFAEMTEDHFKEKFSPISHMYADMETLQDFRLGALICLISTSTEYEYIKHIISDPDGGYQMRLDDLTMKYFPAITDITEDQLSQFIEDSRNHPALVKVSPMTLLYLELNDILRYITDHNTRCEDSDGNITLHIGTNGVTYTEDNMFDLITSIMASNPNFNVTIYNKPLYAIGRDISSYDYILLYDIKGFMAHPYYSSVFDGGLTAFNSTILGFPLLEKEETDQETIKELLANTELIFSIYTTFHYIPRGVGL